MLFFFFSQLRLAFLFLFANFLYLFWFKLRGLDLIGGFFILKRVGGFIFFFSASAFGGVRVGAGWLGCLWFLIWFGFIFFLIVVVGVVEAFVVFEGIAFGGWLFFLVLFYPVGEIVLFGFCHLNKRIWFIWCAFLSGVIYILIEWWSTLDCRNRTRWIVINLGVELLL